MKGMPGLIHLLILRFIAYVIINHVEESMPRGMCCERKGLQTARWEENLQSCSRDPRIQ